MWNLQLVLFRVEPKNLGRSWSCCKDEPKSSFVPKLTASCASTGNKIRRQTGRVYLHPGLNIFYRYFIRVFFVCYLFVYGTVS